MSDITQQLLEKINDLQDRISDLEKLGRPQLCEYRIPGYSAKNGSSAPTAANRAIGESGTVLVPVIKFSNVSQQDVYFLFHSPEEINEINKVYFHVVWIAGEEYASGNFMMKLEYLVKNEDSTVLSGEPVTLSMNVTPSAEDKFIETEEGTGISMTRDQMLVCHFYRDVANDNAGVTLDVVMFEFEYNTR
jgi:hypothetical protein